MKSEIVAKIEREEFIGETNPEGYQSIRFTRIKYKASHESHIDIRKFQRGHDAEGNEEYFPTKIGFRFLESQFRRVMKDYALMPETYIHPEIAKKSFPLLNSGQFESAVMQAFKTIETTIRKLIGAKPEEVGVALIRRAFNPDQGPLTNVKLPKAEREAFSNYIAGAFGYYKNPCSHRNVEMDFVSAFERIFVASDLLKTVENSKSAR